MENPWLEVLEMSHDIYQAAKIAMFSEPEAMELTKQFLHTIVLEKLRGAASQ